MSRWFVTALAIAGVFPSIACQRATPLPSLGRVPAAMLHSSAGEELSLAELEGKVVIYDFIFTRCAATCPMMTARMGELATKLRSEDVRFVSISVDPEWDTAEVLRQYRQKVTTDPRWLFLTGTREGVRDLSVDGFMLAAEPPSGGEDSGPIVHSSRFVLVDRSGAIRGYYESLDKEAMAQVESDARRLLKE